ncbi:hypothetical protein [Paenibacillus sp. PL2-23]
MMKKVNRLLQGSLARTSELFRSAGQVCSGMLGMLQGVNPTM